MEMYFIVKKRVDRIKDFDKHLNIYIIANILLLVFNIYIMAQISLYDFGNQGFVDWVKLNMFITPVCWGLGLLLYGLLVFKYPTASFKDLKPNFLKEWKERQIQKYIEEDKDQ